ncbi:hypothetical protein [Krasilnikovia sp. MM14-A1259]|uniref:hypothetical protein n=1 Tax=Krasilnikovia sp. MM14-A1259 TaxID=3373539 RepID=UPI0037F199BF
MPITEPPAITPLTGELLRSLAENGAGHTAATWHVRFEKAAPSGSYFDGTLTGVAPQDRPIPAADRQAMRKALDAARAAYWDAGDPVRIIDYRLHLGGEGWQAEPAVETFADYRALRAALEPVERRLVAALAELLDDDWTESSLNRSVLPEEPDVLHFRRGRDRTRDTPPPALVALLDELVAVLTAHGRAPWRVKIDVNGERDMHQSDSEYAYGLMR